MEYSVLTYCFGGTLEYANYGESFPNYYQAKKFATGRSFIHGVVRKDRVADVMQRYYEQNRDIN